MALDSKIARIQDRTNALLQEADLKFGTSLYGNVAILFDIRGHRIAGQARAKQVRANSSLTQNTVYNMRVRYNKKYIDQFIDEMLDRVVPHEIAHLVCMQMPIYGRNHNSGWKRVCEQLGGSSSVGHTMTLEGVARKPTFKYKLPSGTIMEIGAKQHATIQAQLDDYPKYSVPAKHSGGIGKVRILSSMYMAESTETKPLVKAAAKKAVAKKVPNKKAVAEKAVAKKVPNKKAATKKDIAQSIFDAAFSDPAMTRKSIIDRFIAEAGMTKSGASTYYQNFKKAAE